MKKLILSIPVPLFLLGLSILAFGLQALWLGFYLDDWVVLYHIYRGGLSRLTAYSFEVNRPFGAWPWWIGFNLLGYSPFLWQLWSIFFRWLTVVLLWWGWKAIWPEKKLQISLAAALMAVSPIFLQQANALTFSDHWICFSLYAFSILAMILAVRHLKYYFLFTLLGLLASGLQLFTIEYFVGLELIRPILLWLTFRHRMETRPRLKRTIFHAFPYALLFAVFIVWRLAFIPTPGSDRNTPSLLFGLFSTPVSTLLNLATNGFQDIVEAVLGSWYPTYQPITITPVPFANLLSWGVVVLASILALAYFLIHLNPAADNQTSGKDSRNWIGFNFIVMLAGFLPAWSINQFLVSTGNYSDRFGLAAMFGASLFIVSLSSYLLTHQHKILLVCLLIGLAAGYQFRLENQFRWSWETKSRLAWQLYWRLPGLQPHTALYGDGVLVTGSWVDVAFLNFLYARPAEFGTEEHWYYDLTRLEEDEIPDPGLDLVERRLEHLYYQGNTSNSLVIQFKTIPNQCLWVIDERDRSNPFLAPNVKSAISLSDPDRIISSAEMHPQMIEVFQAEPVDQWCYYYEKAALAVQEQKWDEVKRLWQAAENKKINSSIGFEYMPFVYGIAQSGDLPTAMTISQRARSLDLMMREPLCQAWEEILAGQPPGQSTNQIQQEVDSSFDCQ